VSGARGRIPAPGARRYHGNRPIPFGGDHADSGIVSGAVDALQSETCDEKLARFFRVQLEIPDLSCTALLLTSYPPKKHILFSVEDTAYVMDAVQYKLAEPAFIPARDVR
jgi:hypothetical protein